MSETITRPLAGKTAIVTGSGQNIGEAIALKLAEAGANIILNGHRNREAIESVAERVKAHQVGAHAILADVSDHTQVKRLVDEATEAFGSVDITVSNVGMRRHQPFEDISIEDWHAVLSTNLSAMFYMAHYAVPGMKARGWGRIIHISGYDGFTGHIPNRAHNIACKAGMHGLSKALAREMGPFGITANTVVPGAIDTERDWSQYPNTIIEEVANRIPVRRWGHVDDIANACAYLACDTGAFVNGQAIHVNGGEYMF